MCGWLVSRRYPGLKFMYASSEKSCCVLIQNVKVKWMIDVETFRFRLGHRHRIDHRDHTCKLR